MLLSQISFIFHVLLPQTEGKDHFPSPGLKIFCLGFGLADTSALNLFVITVPKTRLISMATY